MTPNPRSASSCSDSSNHLKSSAYSFDNAVCASHRNSFEAGWRSVDLSQAQFWFAGLAWAIAEDVRESLPGSPIGTWRCPSLGNPDAECCSARSSASAAEWWRCYRGWKSKRYRSCLRPSLSCGSEIFVPRAPSRYLSAHWPSLVLLPGDYAGFALPPELVHSICCPHRCISFVCCALRSLLLWGCRPISSGWDETWEHSCAG